MSSEKQSKAVLAAICRLEFYKKQKNWKLARDARCDQEDAVDMRQSSDLNKRSKVLNETYCIETHENNEDTALNDAFLYESDTDSPAAQGNQNIQTIPANASVDCSLVGKMLKPWSDYVNDCGEADELPTLCSPDNLLEPKNLVTEPDAVYKCLDGGWTDGILWSNIEPPPQKWSEGSALPVDSFQGSEWQENLVWSEDSICDAGTFWPDDQLLVPERWDSEGFLERSLESVEQFVRGAHAAAHSSQADESLEACAEGRLQACCWQALLCGGRRWRWPSMDCSTGTHPASWLGRDFSSEGVPTRDVGPGHCALAHGEVKAWSVYSNASWPCSLGHSEVDSLRMYQDQIGAKPCAPHHGAVEAFRLYRDQVGLSPCGLSNSEVEASTVYRDQTGLRPCGLGKQEMDVLSIFQDQIVASSQRASVKVGRGRGRLA